MYTFSFLKKQENSTLVLLVISKIDYQGILAAGVKLPLQVNLGN